MLFPPDDDELSDSSPGSVESEQLNRKAAHKAEAKSDKKEGAKRMADLTVKQFSGNLTIKEALFAQYLLFRERKCSELE